MEKYIHDENLALFKRRIAESNDEAICKILMKLLAEEQAKEALPKTVK